MTDTVHSTLPTTGPDVRPDLEVISTPATPTATVSVVIPAHDEARTIGATLTALQGAAHREVLEVVVVANGCSDDTAAVARAAGARVVELATPSKAAALRAGDEAASTFPRIYLDADIRLAPGTLDELADVLRTDAAVVSSPRIVFDTASSSWPVRAFYAAYRELPYIRSGLIGLGVYGMSQTGRARFGEFPDLTADDLFVQRLFADHERITSGGEFVVAAPRDLRNLVKVRTRTAAGSAELSSIEQYGAGGRTGADAPAESATGEHHGETAAAFGRSTGSTSTALLRRALARPASIPSFAVYTAVTIVSRVSARRRQSAAWARDTSTR